MLLQRISNILNAITELRNVMDKLFYEKVLKYALRLVHRILENIQF